MHEQVKRILHVRKVSELASLILARGPETGAIGFHVILRLANMLVVDNGRPSALFADRG